MHEVQHRGQAAEGFASGTNPGYWNRGENYDRAAEKYRDNRVRLLNGLSTEDLALYDEYRSAEREMGAMLDGSMLYDESRMDALEKRSDELYKELYGKEWFGKLNRYDRILGDAGEAVNELYRNTAGEIEARDTAARRRMSAEERKNTPPMLGDADTVFADGNTMAAYAEANGNIRRNNIEYADNAARNAAQKALHDRMVNEGKILDLTENRENVSQYFPDLRSMPKAERTGLLREKIQTLKNDLCTYLNQLKGVNFEFEINGNTIEATVYNAGIKEVLQNLTQDKAGMLSASEEIFRNAEYLYSTQDKTGNSTVTGWDYFYVPIKLGGDAVGVRIAVRNTVKPREAQIYNWGIKREGTSLDGVGHLPKGSNSADVSSDVSSTATIRQTEGNSQEKSSGKASVEVSGINNRTATELDGADTVFADGSISALSVERKITPETNEEARYEILKDRTIRPASVEYDKLGDTDTAAIYDGLSAAQMAQAKKAIRAIAKKLGLHQVDLKNSQIEFPFRFSNANAGVSAQHQSEYGGLYMTVAMTKIKESDVVKKLQAGESAAATSLLSDPNISIQDIFQSVKAGDGRFLKYAPDAFLNDAQKDAKWRAIQRQTEEYASYKLDGNGWSSVEVENRNTKTSEEDARRDFSPAGEPPRLHLAADSFCSITNALMPQKLRLRRNRSAFFSPRQRQTAFPSVQIPSRKAYTKKDSLPHRAGNPFWYARRDLNPRPLAPEANTLSS